MTEEIIIERTTRSLGERGQMRLKADHWREVFGCSNQIIYDLVELSNGTQEVRIRQKQQ